MKNKKKLIFVSLIIVVIILAIVTFLGYTKKNSNSNWYFRQMRVKQIWKMTKGDSQTIAFIDTGISDKLYDKISKKIIYSYNVIDNTEYVDDIHGHGTEMVSVTSSHGYKGVYGIAPQVSLIIIKAVSDEGKTNNDYLYKALKLAEEKMATVVNISLGGYKSDDKVVEQINKMVNNNITIVAAAGDYGNRDLLFPAYLDNVISVEALSESNELWKDSNYSEKSILRMAGCNVDTISVDNSGNLKKETLNGTSEACAIASGYIALIRDYYNINNIDYDNEKLMEVLEKLNTRSDKNINYLLPFERK